MYFGGFPFLVHFCEFPPMKKVLLVSGHPHLDQSLANRTVIDALTAHWGDALEVRDLGALYGACGPVDVKAEQDAILRADVIIYQHPVYWYNVPGLLKSYLDDVLAYGFAYGSTGKAFDKKPVVVSVTCGRAESDYTHEGVGHTVAEFLAQWSAIGDVIGAKMPEVISSYAMAYMPNVHGDDVKAAVTERAKAQAQRVIDCVESL